jgi:hypothetical protein
MVHLFHGILPSNKKVLNYRYMQQIGWILRDLCSMKKYADSI